MEDQTTRDEAEVSVNETYTIGDELVNVTLYEDGSADASIVPTKGDKFTITNWSNEKEIECGIGEKYITVSGEELNIYIPYEDGKIPYLVGWQVLPSYVADGLEDHGITKASKSKDWNR